MQWKKWTKFLQRERMKRKLIIAGTIITANPEDEILINHAVEIENGLIKKIAPAAEFENFNGEILSYPGLVLAPGFVQTHIHLCQTLFRGYADDMELLDWLTKKIFPFENSHTKNSLRASVRLGLNDLIAGGTTTLMDMGTLRNQEVIFEELISSGIRAVAGNCMMDRNDLYPVFKETTDWNLKSTYERAKEFHNAGGGRIKFGFAPRFVLSCSEKLLKETKVMMKDFDGSLFHTHSSENKNEIEAVKKNTGKENIEYFDSIDILDSHTVLAHCIHLNNNEVNLLKKNSARVSHCPSSNLKLGSGIADIPRYLDEGIQVSLGADGAPCNNSLSIFNEMRLAALIQKPVHGPTSMDAKTVYRLATIEGAKALHLDKEIGSIEIGKKADLILLDLEKSDQPIQIEADDPGGQKIYSSIVYSAGKDSVRTVLVDGEILFDGGESKLYDSAELIKKGRTELHEILKKN